MTGTIVAILAAGSGRGERWLQGVVYALFAAMVVVLALLLPAREMLPEMLVLLLALPTFFLWMGWFSRVLLLKAQAAGLCLPGLPHASEWSLVAMALLTVVLPAALLALVGADPVWSASCLACFAAVGLLFALLQRGLAGLLGFLPMLLALVDGNMVLVLVDWHSAMPAIAALLLLLAAWRWLRVSAALERWNEPDWRQPLVFAMGRRGSIFGGSDLLDPKVQQGMVPRWLRHGANLRALRPGGVGMLRTLLGGVFAPVGWRQLLATLAMYAMILVLLLAYFTREGEAPWQMLLFMGLFTGGMLLLAPFALRLQGLQQGHGGEMAELALLPGWGEAGQARATLLRAVAIVFLRMAVVVLLLMAAAAAMTGQPLVVVLAVVSTLAIVVAGVVAWLRPLAGRPWRLNLFAGVVAVLFGVPLLGCTVGAFDGGVLLLPMIGTWSVLLLLAHWPALRLWARFRQRPHPFLMY